MLVIKIELWPYGYATGARELGRMYIINDGTGTAKRGNYRVDRWTGAQTVHYRKIKNWPRMRKNVWALLKAALK